jgi:hypothetical protein
MYEEDETVRRADYGATTQSKIGAKVLQDVFIRVKNVFFEWFLCEDEENSHDDDEEDREQDPQNPQENP